MILGLREEAEAGPESGGGNHSVRGWQIEMYCLSLSVFSAPQPHFDPEACSFRELLLKDGYNVYQSEAHGLPLRLPQKDSQDPATRGPVRFLPMPGLPHEPQEQPGVLPPEPPDVGSSDPLSMVEPLQGRSPSYAS